ncbi:MAG TPA: hypothetical protein VK463_19980 [Desulfomonilaceae bacterium]|nr:hypothetical protein [Desulfomonilaceae bacterium]
MKRIFYVVVMVCAFTAANATLSQADGNSVDPGRNEALDILPGTRPGGEMCSELQDKIDNVVNLSRAGLSDKEKIAKLSALFSQSMAALTKSSEKDSEIDAITKQYKFLFETLLAAAMATSSDDAKITPDTKDELQKLKIMTANYVALMRLLCPGLKLPENMSH